MGETGMWRAVEERDGAFRYWEEWKAGLSNLNLGAGKHVLCENRTRAAIGN